MTGEGGERGVCRGGDGRAGGFGEYARGGKGCIGLPAVLAEGLGLCEDGRL